MVVIVVPLGRVTVVDAPGAWKVVWAGWTWPLPNEIFCAASVPDQSMPLVVLGELETSIKRVSIKTWRVGLSSCSMSIFTASCSFSEATTTNWLVRESDMTLLRLSVSELPTASCMLETLEYLS